MQRAIESSFAAASVSLCALWWSAAIAGEPGLACFAPGQTPAAVIAACGSALNGAELPDGARAAVLLARADAEAASAAHEAAKSDYDAVLRLDGSNIAALLGRARLTRIDDAATAEADYSKIIVLAVAEPALAGAAYAERGQSRLARGAVADGIADLGEARRLAPDNPAPFKVRGAYLLEQKDYAAAEGDLARAAALDPRDADSARLLGLARLALGQSDAALAALDAAVTLAPHDGATLRARATAHAQKRDFAATMADFSAAIAVNGKDAEAWKGRGVAALQSGSFDQAVVDLDTALKLRPEDVQVLFLRGEAHLQKADMAAAEADLSHFLVQHPGDEEALFDRALAREFQGNLAGAETDFATILGNNPKAARALSGRGAVRVMRGSYAEAALDFAAALSLTDAPADLTLWKFIAGARAGDKGALAALQMAWPDQHGDDAQPWPAPVARYFLGALSGDHVLAVARAAGKGSGGRLCEAYFYLGEAALMQHDLGEATRLFTAARNTGMRRYTEYAAAGAELSRLRQSPPPAGP